MKILIILSAFFMVIYSSYAQSPTTFPEKPEVVFVKGGTFSMGSNSGDHNDERPVHLVTLSDFYIGKYEVTVAQYRAFVEDLGRRMPKEPEWGWNDRHPIVHVSHEDAEAYCSWLSQKFGGNWRLPTEAEWEYAARGGAQSRGYTYAGGNDQDAVGWYGANAGGQVNAVGKRKANELGIYDMSGNAHELCSDWYGDYSADAQTNPQGPSSGRYRVRRGGAFDYTGLYTVTGRDFVGPSSSYRNQTFRVVFSQ